MDQSSVLLTKQRKRIQGEYTEQVTNTDTTIPGQQHDATPQQESQPTFDHPGQETPLQKAPKALSGTQHFEILDRVHSNVSHTDWYKPIHTFAAGDQQAFMQIVKEISDADTPAPRKSPLKFEFTLTAAKANAAILEESDYDYETHVTNHENNSSLAMGSELRPISQLDKLLSHHPGYPLFRWNTIHGIDYPADDLPEEIRIRELDEQINKGNHKSALDKDARAHVDKAMISDIELGYGIPLTINCIKKLKHAEVYPVELQHQLTIDEHGNIIPKKRISHDLSNKRDKGLSISQRVKEHLLPSVLYGYTLLRFLHLIHNIRWNNPNKAILMNKIDIEKAYRRFHTTPKIAAKCIALWKTKENEEIGIMLT